MAAIENKTAIGEDDQQLQLTDLPDEILIRILSLLPTEDAVRICLLLLRSGQQHLWKSLTSLEFHEGDMLGRGTHFRNFVDRVMDLRDHSSSLVSFSLRYQEEEKDDVNRIKTWITKVAQCHSLVKLDLESITFNVPSSAIFLPRLKYLRLCDVNLEGEESTEKLFSSPLLEELIIDQCIWDIAYIRVCSPKLQVLKICDKYYPTRDVEYYFSEICIVADNLKYFDYKGDLMNQYSICASSSTQLSKVDISVNREMMEDLGPNCYRILKGLSGTRNLALSDYFLKGLENFSELVDSIPTFEFLTRLDFEVYAADIRIDSLVLLKIYERCPHLEYLNFHEISRTVRSRPQLRLSPIPLCFQTCLKKILVHYYVPRYEDDAALVVLLKSAIVLKELVIYCPADRGFYRMGRTIQELQDKLNRCPRASKDCIISVRVYEGFLKTMY